MKSLNHKVGRKWSIVVASCSKRAQGYIFFYNPPQGGGKESKDLRAREENQRKKGKEGEREGDRGIGKEKGRKMTKGRKRKEKKRRVQKERNEQEKNEGKGKEVYGQGCQCKRTEKLWDYSDNT